MIRRTLVPIRLWVAQALGSGLTLVSGVLDLRKGDPSILMFRIVGTGSADAKIEIASSNDGLSFGSYTAQDPIVASSNTQFSSLLPEEFHAYVVPRYPFAKIQVTELASLADSVVDATLWVLE